MDEVQTRRSGLGRGLIAVAVLLIVIAAFLFYQGRQALVPLRGALRPETPVLELDVQLLDINKNRIEDPASKLIAAEKMTPEEGLSGCPDLQGGDMGRSTLDVKTWETERRVALQKCPKRAAWKVIRHPVAMSIYFSEGKAFLRWFLENPQFAAVRNHYVFQALFREASLTLQSRAIDLNLEGWKLKEHFLQTLLADALGAGGVLHYDIAHGKQGLVFSFVRRRATLVSPFLPTLLREIGRSAYRLEKLDDPVFELTMVKFRLFVTSSGERVYVANGLESLLNVLDQQDLDLLPPVEGTLQVALRGEAFLKGLMPLLSGRDHWRANFGFDLRASSTRPHEGVIERADVFRSMAATPFEGVLASLPSDISAALVTSIGFPWELGLPEWTSHKWQGRPAPSRGGIAIAWDISAANGESAVGVAISAPTDGGSAMPLDTLFSSVSTSCAQGSVALAATSENLLTRMRESCERQSLSIMDWKDREVTRILKESQTSMFLNMGATAAGLYEAGRGTADASSPEDPDWKKAQRKAMAAAKGDARALFATLPTFGFAGGVKGEDLRLNGFTVTGGGAR